MRYSPIMNDILDASAVDAKDSKVQLILAGEKLFAEKGIEAASLREIASLAGHGNNNAVRYHFGSKQGLIQAIFRHRVTQMEPIRAELINKLESEKLSADTRAILEVIVLPHFTLRAPDGTISYPAFLLQYLLYYRPRGVRHTADEAGELSPALNRAQNLLRTRIGYLGPEIADNRILHAMITFVTAIIGAENAMPKLRIEQYRTLIDDTLDQIVASLVLQTSSHKKTLIHEFIT